MKDNSETIGYQRESMFMVSVPHCAGVYYSHPLNRVEEQTVFALTSPWFSYEMKPREEAL